RDQSHVRINSLSEIKKMFEETGTVIKDISHWEIPQDFDEWIRRAGTDEETIKKIRRLMTESLANDSTGLHVKIEDGKLGFIYDTIILIADAISFSS
ncbi:MAG: hypothetical protein QSU88_00205, partial [Candidatus Methanoperedens sp.]|nr:hypothetical protein [Candidatus Methanoperedens sp.]